MYHLKPSSKGDPLCPLGFHPQVRWPTRCKRCFRDYKEHGNKKDTPSLRKDEFALSTPTLSSASPFSRSRSEDIQDSSLGARTWTSSSNLSTLGTAPTSTQISDQLKERGSSWTSSPNLAESQAADNVTVSITLPRRRRPVPPEHQVVEDRMPERRRETDYSSSRNNSSARDYSSTRNDTSARDYSSSRPDSSARDHVSSRNDSSARDYSSSRNGSSARDYSSSRTDSSTRDYGSSRTDSSARDYGSSRTDSSARDYGSRNDSSAREYSRTENATLERSLNRTAQRERRADPRSEYKADSRTENLLNSSSNKPEVDFMFHVKSLSGQKGGESNRSSRRGSSSSDDAGTVTTDTTLVNMRENQLLEEIESLKKELDLTKVRCEKAEREKSDLMLRRLASIESTSSKSSESLKLQQKVNELKMQVEDLRDDKKSLTLKVREVESELDCIKATGAQREVEQLRNKMDKAEQLIEQLMEENQDMRREIRDMEEEMLEMQDTFRDDQADEYSSLKKELEQATKKCRILTFKLKKSERKTEQLDAEKLEMERKIREIAGGQAGLDKAERIRQLEHELKVANEAGLRLQKDLDDAQSKLKESSTTSSKKKAPLLGTIPKTPSGEKVSRASLVRGGSQEDPAQLLRDLQDSLEREADLREQLKHTEEEVEIFRKKASRVEEDNESLVLQLKKMATKARSRRLSPTANRLNPEDKDEGISDEDDPADLRIQLELNEQEACVLRRKVEELESERDAINRKNRDLQDKLTAKLSTVAKQQALHSNDSNSIYQHKIKVMEGETSELRMKLIEKERECERLHAEISLSNKKPKLLQKSKSLDGDPATVDLKRQLQVIESEAAILRTKIQDLESDNEKLLTENKRLIMLKGARRAGSVERSDEPKPLVIATLEKQLDDANKKIKELQTEKEQNKDAEPPPPNTEELDKAKLQLKKAEMSKKKLEESIERMKQESSLNTIDFFVKRKPRQPTLQTTKQQLKKWVDESENDINELLISLKKAQESGLPNGSLDKTAVANVEMEKKKLETQLKEIKEQSAKKDKELEEIKSQIKTLEQDKTKSKKETDSSKTVWEKEKSKLTTAKEELEKKKTHLEKQVTDLQNEMKDLKKSTEEVASLKKKMDALNRSMEEEKKQNEELKQQLKNSGDVEEDTKKLLKEIEDKKSKATELENSMKELEEKLKKSEKLLSTKKDKLIKMEKEKTEKEKKLDEIEKSVATLSSEKKDLSNKVEEHESKIKQLKNELERKKKTIEELEQAGGQGKGVLPNSDELRQLRDELDAKQTNIEELENKLKNANKEKEDSQQMLNSKEKDLQKKLEQWEKKISDLENDLQVANEETAAERKMMERLKASQELEIKGKEQEIAQLQTKNLTSGTKKINDLKHEMQSKIDRLEMALDSEKREYEELTGKYEELEEEHVVTKAQLVKEKETIKNQLLSTEEELRDLASEQRTLRETLSSKQDAWTKEKLKLQEKLNEAEKKSGQLVLESQKLDAVSQGKQLDIDQFKKEINDLRDQNDRLRRDNEELKRQMEDFDKVVKVQRSMNAEVDLLEKDVKEYKTRLVMEEKTRKKELAAQKSRYDSRVAVLSNELLGLQGQVARFKKERDSYKKIMEETQRQAEGGQPSTNRLPYDGDNAVPQLQQQVGCLEEELSEARLEASRLRTELLSEKSAWQLRHSELTSKMNEMEEEKVLMGGRTKITGVKTRMELAWHKEREEQQRLLQETSTLARDLRQTLFEVERERDRERLEAKRRLEQVKRNSEEEQEDQKKKLHEMQCDILELRDAHAKLRTTNEKLRRERDKWDRERDAVRHMINERKKIEQEDERKIISVAQLVEELTHLAPGLFPTKPRAAGVTPTPPVRRKSSKSREASPLLERRDMSRESSVGRDEAKSSEMSEILLRLSEAAQQLRKHSSEAERAKRSLSMRAGSMDSDSGIEPIQVKMRPGHQKTNSNLRKSFSLEQTQQEQQAIWRPDSESREGSVQSIDDETYQRIMMSRESSMDSRLSGGSTRSEMVTSSEKKKKSGLFGKLKKLARSRSTDRDSDAGSDIGSMSQVSESDYRLQKKPPTSTLKKIKKTS